MSSSSKRNERTGFPSRVRQTLGRTWDKIKYFYMGGSWDLWTGRKSQPHDYWGRCRQVCFDPNNQYIPRVRDAGRIVDGNLIMHNGLKVKMGPFAYYDDFSRIVLATNRGVHEPQEERLFQEVLRHLPRNATMIELGAYWAFYSMWFKHAIADGRCFMIEPDEARLESGRENFKLNQMEGKFVHGKMGVDGIRVDDFLDQHGIETVHLLHADIQGAEWEMLHSCERIMAENRIWYFFISTHSQALHYRCLRFLEDRGYVIVSTADFDRGTYCGDGILVARSAKIRGLEPIEIPLRRDNRPVLPSGSASRESRIAGLWRSPGSKGASLQSGALAVRRTNGLPFTTPADDQIGRQGHARLLQRLRERHLDYPCAVTLETHAEHGGVALPGALGTPHGRGGKMSDRLFEKILDDLASRPGASPKWFRLGRWSEPFSDPRIFRFSRRIVERFPESRLRFRTNAAALDRKKLCRLLALPNIEMITVSLGEHRPGEHEETVHLPATQTMDNLRHFHKRQAAGAVSFRVKICLVGDGTRADDEFLEQVRRAFPLFEHAILPPVAGTPRDAGLAPDASDLGCLQWFHLHLLADGREAFCCLDAEGHRGAGRASREHVLNIYNRSERRRLRELLPARKEAAGCANCPAMGISVKRRPTFGDLSR